MDVCRIGGSIVTSHALSALPEMDVSRAYAAKSDGYFAGARADFVALLPDDRKARILEIGCGSGDTARLVRSAGKCARYVGVELFPDAAARARDAIDDVIVGDVEAMAFNWDAGAFDALILSEVLEHLREPWSLVARLAPHVRRGGLVMASSPNAAHWRVLRTLARGDFPRHDQGVFDRTHLRWFTPRTFRALFEDAGFQVRRLAPVTPFSARTRALSRLSAGRLDHLFMTQISVVAERV